MLTIVIKYDIIPYLAVNDKCKKSGEKEFELIDWRKIDKDSRNSLIYDICTFYTKQSKDFTKISDYFNVSSSTVNKYLKIGSDLGFCKFNPKEHQQNILKKKAILLNRLLQTTNPLLLADYFRDNILLQKLSHRMGINRLQKQLILR